MDDVQQIEHEIDGELPALLHQARAVTILDQADAQDAAELLHGIAGRRRAVEEWFKPLVEAAHRAHRELTQRRAAVLEKFAEPERIVRKALADYQAAQVAKRHAAEAAARAAAQQAADDARLARAERAWERGDTEQAERILDGQAPEPIVVVPVVEDAEPLSGVAFVTQVRAECVDKAALVKAAAVQPHLLPLLEVNTKALNQMAKALGDALNIPGVVVRRQQITRVA